jgi:hypothetical protein
MTDTANTAIFNYPKYNYTFKVVSLSASTQHILVEFLPEKESLTKITLNLPIFATFNPSDLESYVDKFAPHSKWFGEEMIINYESLLVGANSNIIVE